MIEPLGTAVKQKRRGRPENLKPFPKGTSGNPAGRPSWLPLCTALRKELGKQAPPSLCEKLLLPKSATWEQAVARRLVISAATGDVAAASLIFNRVEGKLPEHVSVQSQAIDEIKISVHFDEPPICLEGEEDQLELPAPRFGGQSEHRNDEP